MKAKKLDILLMLSLAFAGCTPVTYVSGTVVENNRRVWQANVYLQYTDDGSIPDIPAEPTSEPDAVTNIIGTFEFRFADYRYRDPEAKSFLVIYKDGFRPLCVAVDDLKTMGGGPWVGQFNSRSLNLLELSEADEPATGQAE